MDYLVKGEKQFRLLIADDDNIALLLDEKLNVIFRNTAATLNLPWQEGNFHALLERYGYPGEDESFEKVIAESFLSPGKSFPVTLRLKHKNGGDVLLDGSVKNLLYEEQVNAILIQLTDITKTEEAKESMLATNRLHLFINRIHKILLRSTDREFLFDNLCREAIESGKFTMAWIGIFDEKTKMLNPVYHAEVDGIFFSNLKIGIDKQAGEQNVSLVRDLRNGKTILNNDAESSRLGKSANTLQTDSFSTISIPFKQSGKIFGVFNLHAGGKDFIGKEQIALLEETAADISFVLDSFVKKEIQKESQQAIEASGRHYETLTEMSPVGIFHTDSTGYTTYVNPYWCAISGLSGEEALGNGWLNAVHKDDREKLSEGWIQATKDRKLSISEYRFVRKDGSIAWVMGQAVPEINSSNEVIGYIGTITNITDRKISEEKLKRSNIQLSLSQTISHIGYWESDFRNETDFWSDEMFRLVGIGNDQAPMNMETFIKNVHADDREILEKDLEAAMENKAPLNSEFRYTRQDGTIANFISIGNFINDKDGRPALMVGITQDITQRKKIENEILKEKKLSDSIINSLPGIFYMSDRTPKLLRWNEAFEMISGYSSGELESVVPIKIFDPEDHPHFRISMEKAYREGFADVEARILTKDGRKIPYYFTGVRIEYQGVQVLLGIGIDISDQKKADEAIKESEEKYRTLVEQASDAIYIANEEGHIITVNPSACKLSGYSESELLEKSIYEFVFAEDLKEKPFRFDDLRQGKTVTIERRFKVKGGKILYLECIAKMLSDGRILVFARDISDRLQAQNDIIKEKNFSDAIINSLPGIFYLYDESGNFLRWNRNFEYVSGYTRREITRMKPLDFFDVSEKELLKQKGEVVFGKGQADVEAHFLTKNNEKIPYFFYGLRVIFEGKICLIGVGIDITEKWKAEELLKKSYEDIRKLASHLTEVREEERKRIGREIHDELGQQLTAIKMDVAWIDKKIPLDTAQVKTKIKNIIELLDDSNKSIRRILSELRSGVLDDHDLLGAVEWLGKNFTANTGIPVTFIFADKRINVPEPIGNCIFRLCQEAFTNITRYSKASEVVVSINNSGNRVTASVEDNGIGFNVDSIEYNKSFGILGMRERVLSLGGEFEVISSRGSGTKIALQIPYIVS